MVSYSLLLFSASTRGGVFSDHRYLFCVCVTLLQSGSVSELQKWRQATAEAEVRLIWETDAHVWTQTGSYATPAAAPVTGVSSFHSSSVSSCLPLGPSPPLFSVRVTQQLATSIKVGDPINSHRLSSHPPCRRTQVVLFLMYWSTYRVIWLLILLLSTDWGPGGIDRLQTHVGNSRTVWVRRKGMMVSEGWQSEEHTEGHKSRWVRTWTQEKKADRRLKSWWR